MWQRSLSMMINFTTITKEVVAARAWTAGRPRGRQTNERYAGGSALRRGHLAGGAAADRAAADDAGPAGAPAAPAWTALSAFDRAAACENVAAAVLRRADELA